MKLLELVKEINRLLEEKEARLKRGRTTTPNESLGFAPVSHPGAQTGAVVHALPISGTLTPGHIKFTDLSLLTKVSAPNTIHTFY